MAFGRRPRWRLRYDSCEQSAHSVSGAQMNCAVLGRLSQEAGDRF